MMPMEEHGGTPAPTSPVTVEPGDTITQPPAMTKTWHTFGGWYTDSARTVPAVFPVTVTANVNLYARWILNTFTSIADVTSYLASLPANTVNNSASLAVNISLGTMTAADSGWRQLLDAINTSGKFVNLDLSSCTMSGTSFNPDSSVATGKDWFVSLVLPAAATSIEAGAILDSTFGNFTNLTSVSGANITTIGNYAFGSSYSTTSTISLQSVNFPLVTSIDEGAFEGCTALQSVNFPQVTSISSDAFGGCTSLQSAGFPQVTTIGNRAFSRCTDLQSLNIPKVTRIFGYAFSSTGTATLSITMGPTAPTLGENIFYGVTSAKTVMVNIPSGATGYTPFNGSTVTVSGTNTAANWANGFRGGSWNGTTWESWGGTSGINQDISVVIEQQ